MKYMKLIYHLAGKCSAQPTVQHLYRVCRYNWVHRVLIEELAEHEEKCPFREVLAEGEWQRTEQDLEEWLGSWDFEGDPVD